MLRYDYRFERGNKLLTRDSFNPGRHCKRSKALIIIAWLHDAVMYREILIVTRKSLFLC